MQASYQWVEDGKINGSQFEDVNDFMIRRAYLYLKADVTKYVSFFTHLASDKVGLEKPTGGNLDDSGLGRGSGMAVVKAATIAARVNRLAGHYAKPTPAMQVMEMVQHIPRALSEILQRA